ncbi:MAG: hypothetical protein A3D67_04055 [Candidatus Lloydbacteria bacterium RIFCSPHIGHO2_02_FULL_51_22]|uniref:Uncharacterized protein n=2 Tax=Candidatus Lloydiibacteriota TaxID=1817910 RepID=A0A1G2D9B6_9BACT|nr:MAG: hypothetical protein A3D67_04055 [Candidatus Lloydbacteria bacterium RIFCSPHIGHO2_02_FULL_51_22]OGZ15610.1 MAG: hypothetical protein A3J08_00225 [Candidatus Lloydbacteria bacterium RIFCSPLOWO2_02_FULL_51_11]
MNKRYIQAGIQVLIILAIGVGFVWFSSSFNKEKPPEEIVREVVKDVVRKKPSCPNTSDYFNELKSTGQIVVLAKDLKSYGANGLFTNIKRTVVKSPSSGSQIACGYLFVKAQADNRPLQQQWEHPYVKPGQFGGHLSLESTIANKEVENTTELLFNLSNMVYTEKLSSELRKADWAALLNVSDRTDFDIALNTTDPGGIINEVSIAYQCWSPETGQSTHDCRLIVE